MKPWFLLLLIVFCAVPVLAQDATPEASAGWALEERCLPAPAAPPAGWTFSGTIIATGRYGLHGITEAWDTPRVLVELNSRQRRDSVAFGTLSPDARRYAQVTGYTITEQSYTRHHVYEALELYSTYDDSVTIFEAIGRNDRIGYGARVPFMGWYGEDVIFGGLRWQITEGVLTPLAELDVPNFSGDMEDRAPAPDWTRIVEFPIDGPVQLFSSESAEPVADLGTIDTVSWAPDSSSMIAYSVTEGLLLFDCDGGQRTVIAPPLGALPRQAEVLGIWAPDGRRFVAGLSTQLYLIDLNQQTVTGLCIQGWASRGVGAWSPDGRLFALIDSTENTSNLVQIVDLERWSRYGVAVHDGRVLGWRAED